MRIDQNRLLDEIALVLHGTGKALHYTEITERVLDAGEWSSEGETPEQTVNSYLSMDVSTFKSASRFVRVEPGVYALNPAVPLNPNNLRPFRGRGLRIVEGTSHTSDSYPDAAERVLLDTGRQIPMHFKQITKLAIDRGLVRTRGQTPAATMKSSLDREIAASWKQGKEPRFVAHSNGFFGLRRWTQSGISS